MNRTILVFSYDNEKRFFIDMSKYSYNERKVLEKIK